LQIFAISQAQQKGSTPLNATEFASDKFNAFFTAHDTKDKELRYLIDTLGALVLRPA
jgi:hypothetical protein